MQVMCGEKVMDTRSLKINFTVFSSILDCRFATIAKDLRQWLEVSF